MTLPSSSVDSLFDQAKSYIAQHRADTPIPPAPANRGRFPQNVYDQIDEAALLADTTTVQPFLTPPSVPIIGPLWQRVRLAAHNLVVFYVNRHAGAQTAFNREVAGGLRDALAALEEDGGPATALEVAALRVEVQALQQRLVRLEQRGARGTNGAE